MSTQPLRPGELPPLELRPHRRMIPELELPSVRRRQRPDRTVRAVRPARPERGPRPERVRRTAAVTTPTSRAQAESSAPHAALYWRLLRLRHVHPNGWQRALFVEGSIAVALVLVLAGAATIWTLLVLPLAVAAVVKGNDLVMGELTTPADSREPRKKGH